MPNGKQEVYFNMTPAEALSVKVGDIVKAIFETKHYTKEEEFYVKFLRRYDSGKMHDTGVDLIALKDGREILSNLQDFHFADITKSFRTSTLWVDYIVDNKILSEDRLLDLINGFNNLLSQAKSQCVKDSYTNELKACEVMLDILNGYRDKYGIEICEIQS